MFTVKQLSLKYKIMIYVISMICLVLIFAGFIVINDVINNVHTSISNRALAIGRVIANVDDVQKALVSSNPSEILQPIAENWRQATGAAFIVISNMDEIRLSHPEVSKIGTPMVKLDRELVLHGQEFVTVAKGVLDPALRAYVPIFDYYDKNKQVGFISVGFYLDDIAEKGKQSAVRVFYAFLLAVVLCSVGSCILANNVKKAIFDLEPYEIAKIVKEHAATLQAIREGLIAVDINGIINIINDEAERMLGIPREQLYGKAVFLLFPMNNLQQVINAGETIFDHEIKIGDLVVMANIVPIEIEGRLSGAVISFRDRTEVIRLAEEITGVKTFVDIMRAQAHEYKNKLHAISGLIQLGRAEEAVDYIIDSCLNKEYLYEKLSMRIKDSIVFGLLMGKSKRMRELGIEMDIAPESSLTSLPKNFASGDMVLVLGNLLENAIDVLEKEKNKKIVVTLKQDNNGIYIRVWNSGPWINEEINDKIYEKGITTKGSKRGIGLALVKEKVELNKGTIYHRNLASGGVEFNVYIPKDTGVDNNGSIKGINS